ncbi:hypothetical protein IE53DRAFT_369840 [Violaceomyces palustris]|uniref:Uncharacterized protein n=1 Tax=Violaceomyces palustris TaxID=1673888 RepID=A0ACD0NUD7_9BASI|nr:hypothetical protein IE53DRAFT_369840 [Violaceomyces palustris]
MKFNVEIVAFAVALLGFQTVFARRQKYIAEGAPCDIDGNCEQFLTCAIDTATQVCSHKGGFKGMCMRPWEMKAMSKYKGCCHGNWRMIKYDGVDAAGVSFETECA